MGDPQNFAAISPGIRKVPADIPVPHKPGGIPYQQGRPPQPGYYDVTPAGPTAQMMPTGMRRVAPDVPGHGPLDLPMPEHVARLKRAERATDRALTPILGTPGQMRRQVQEDATPVLATGFDASKGDAPSGICPKELAAGIKVESEHTDDPAEAKRIAIDHLEETPDYYSRLEDAGLSDDEGEDFAAMGKLKDLAMSGQSAMQKAGTPGPMRKLANVASAATAIPGMSIANLTGGALSALGKPEIGIPLMAAPTGLVEAAGIPHAVAGATNLARRIKRRITGESGYMPPGPKLPPDIPGGTEPIGQPTAPPDRPGRHPLHTPPTDRPDQYSIGAAEASPGALNHLSPGVKKLKPQKFQFQPPEYEQYQREAERSGIMKPSAPKPSAPKHPGVGGMGMMALARKGGLAAPKPVGKMAAPKPPGMGGLSAPKPPGGIAPKPGLREMPPQHQLPGKPQAALPGPSPSKAEPPSKTLTNVHGMKAGNLGPLDPKAEATQPTKKVVDPSRPGMTVPGDRPGGTAPADIPSSVSAPADIPAQHKPAESVPAPQPKRYQTPAAATTAPPPPTGPQVPQPGSLAEGIAQSPLMAGTPERAMLNAARAQAAGMTPMGMPGQEMPKPVMGGQERPMMPPQAPGQPGLPVPPIVGEVRQLPPAGRQPMPGQAPQPQEAPYQPGPITRAGDRLEGFLVDRLEAVKQSLPGDLARVGQGVKDLWGGMKQGAAERSAPGESIPERVAAGMGRAAQAVSPFGGGPQPTPQPTPQPQPAPQPTPQAAPPITKAAETAGGIPRPQYGQPGQEIPSQPKGEDIGGPPTPEQQASAKTYDVAGGSERLGGMVARQPMAQQAAQQAVKQGMDPWTVMYILNAMTPQQQQQQYSEGPIRRIEMTESGIRRVV